MNNGRSGFHPRYICVLCVVAVICERLLAFERMPQMIENIILIVISTLLLAYLVFALLRPEKF